MKTNHQLIKIYKNLIQTTQIQTSYQYIIEIIHNLYLTLKKDLNTYQFSHKVIENHMNFSYFQLTNPQLKKQGLKIQIIFILSIRSMVIWLQSPYSTTILSNSQIYMSISTM